MWACSVDWDNIECVYCQAVCPVAFCSLLWNPRLCLGVLQDAYILLFLSPYLSHMRKEVTVLDDLVIITNSGWLLSDNNIVWAAVECFLPIWLTLKLDAHWILGNRDTGELGVGGELCCLMGQLNFRQRWICLLRSPRTDKTTLRLSHSREQCFHLVLILLWQAK